MTTFRADGLTDALSPDDLGALSTLLTLLDQANFDGRRADMLLLIKAIYGFYDSVADELERESRAGAGAGARMRAASPWPGSDEPEQEVEAGLIAT
jgi:hypothetical protein